MKSLRFLRPFSLLILLGGIGFLSGCSASMDMPDALSPSDFGTVQGGVYGGRQPIAAAHLYMFQADTNTGYGTNAPTSLLGNAVSTYDAAGKCTQASHAVTLPLVYDSTIKGCYYLTGGANPSSMSNPQDTQTGGFNLTGLYSCTPGMNVWLFSISGFPTTGTTANLRNPYAGLMADLGPCPTTGAANFSRDTFIYMNELSTVAMAYALAGFTGNTLTTGYSGTGIRISSPSSNVTGLNNAFLTAQQLYNIFGAGDQGDLSAPQSTPYGARNGSTPYFLINTVGDMLASCVNSTGENTGTVGSGGMGAVGACANLFEGTYGSNSDATATDTASAAINIAQHPAVQSPGNFTELLNLSGSNGPWLPNNSSSGSPVFNDLAAAIQYSGTSTLLGTFSPQGIASDVNGNIYTNAYTNSGYVVKLSPLGVVSTTAAGSVNEGSLIAVAAPSGGGNGPGIIWSPGAALGNVYATTNTSALTSVSSPIAPGTLSDSSHPIAPDNNGFVYVGDGTNAELLETNGATTLTIPGATIGNGCLTGVNGVALDNTGVLWSTGSGNPDVVCRFSSAGHFYVGVGGSSSPTPIFSANAVAVDGTENAWVTTVYSTVYEIDHTSGDATEAVGGGGLSRPVGIAIDGYQNLGNLWIANAGTGSITELNNSGTALTGSNGFQKGLLTDPRGIVIDIAGNVWVANYGAADVIEVIGAATPTAALSKMTPGAKP